jgi:flap endonuclease-1
MGIKNLKVILSQKCGLAINERKLDNYRGMTLGIDLSIFLYKYLYNNDDHIEGLTRLILRLLKNHITPVFIFDGKPPTEKSDTLKQRKEKRNILSIRKEIYNKCINTDRAEFKDINEFNENMKKYISDNFDDFEINQTELKALYEKPIDELREEHDKIAKKIIYVKISHIENAMKLFDLFGIGYIQAPSEAETLMAILCKDGHIDGCISEDTDILANGGTLFLRNFNASGTTVEEYCLDGILSCLNFTHDQFIDMCILCGCDYTTKINSLGPINAYKLINEHKNIEAIIEQFKTNHKFAAKFKIPDNFDYLKARELFKNPVPESELALITENIQEKIKIKMKTPEELEVLKEFLKTTKLNNKYFKEIDKNLINYYLDIDNLNHLNNINNKLSENKLSEKKITDFFGKK